MRNKIHAAALTASARLFTFVLPLYPATLRREFGADMADVFDQQLRGECERKGLAGVLRVWAGVAGDVLHSSLPIEIDWRVVVVRAFSLVGSFVLFALFFEVSHIAARCMK